MSESDSVEYYFDNNSEASGADQDRRPDPPPGQRDHICEPGCACQLHQYNRSAGTSYQGINIRITLRGCNNTPAQINSVSLNENVHFSGPNTANKNIGINITVGRHAPVDEQVPPARAFNNNNHVFEAGLGSAQEQNFAGMAQRRQQVPHCPCQQHAFISGPGNLQQAGNPSLGNGRSEAGPPFCAHQQAFINGPENFNQQLFSGAPQLGSAVRPGSGPSFPGHQHNFSGPGNINQQRFAGISAFGNFIRSELAFSGHQHNFLSGPGNTNVQRFPQIPAAFRGSIRFESDITFGHQPNYISSPGNGQQQRFPAWPQLGSGTSDPLLSYSGAQPDYICGTGNLNQSRIRELPSLDYETNLSYTSHAHNYIGGPGMSHRITYPEIISIESDESSESMPMPCSSNKDETKMIKEERNKKTVMQDKKRKREQSERRSSSNALTTEDTDLDTEAAVDNKKSRNEELGQVLGKLK